MIETKDKLTTLQVLKYVDTKAKNSLQVQANDIAELDLAASGNIYDYQEVTSTGTQTVPNNALYNAFVVSCTGADTVRVHSKNLLNLRGQWQNNCSYQQLPLSLQNGNYVLSMDRNLCNKTGNPYTGVTYAAYINKSGLTSATQIASSESTIRVGNTGSTASGFCKTQIPFTTTQSVSLYVLFSVRPKPTDYLDKLNHLFGLMQIESGTLGTKRQQYFVKDYSVTGSWDSKIAVNSGGKIEYLSGGQTVSISNTIRYDVKISVPSTENFVRTIQSTKQDYQGKINVLSGETAVRTTPVYCWGDSLTQGQGSNFTLSDGVFTQFNLHPYTNQIRNHSVVNLGCQGQSMITIMARQGADPMTVGGFTIPADTSDVIVGNLDDGIATRSGGKAYPLNPNEAGINPCVISGVTGILHRGTTQNGSDKNIYFRRLQAGTSVSVTKSVVNTFAMRYYHGGIAVIWAGANGGSSGVFDLCDKIKSMVAYGEYDNYLVVISRQFSASDVSAIRTRLNTDGIDHVLYIIPQLVSHGLTLANMVHYYFDTSSYAQGDELLLKAPILCQCSLSTTGQPTFGRLHFSAYGYKAIGKIVNTRINELQLMNSNPILGRNKTDSHGNIVVVLETPYTNMSNTIDTKWKAYDSNKDWTVILKWSDCVVNHDGTYGSIMELRDDTSGITLHMRYVASDDKLNMSVSKGYGFDLTETTYFDWHGGHLSTDGHHYLCLSKSGDVYRIIVDGSKDVGYTAPLAGATSQCTMLLFGRVMPNGTVSQRTQATISDFRVYDSSMQMTELEQIYNEMKG